jgi:hypothetical protein
MYTLVTVKAPLNKLPTIKKKESEVAIRIYTKDTICFVHYV